MYYFVSNIFVGRYKHGGKCDPSPLQRRRGVNAQV